MRGFRSLSGILTVSFLVCSILELFYLFVAFVCNPRDMLSMIRLFFSLFGLLRQLADLSTLSGEKSLVGPNEVMHARMPCGEVSSFFLFVFAMLFTMEL